MNKWDFYVYYTIKNDVRIITKLWINNSFISIFITNIITSIITLFSLILHHYEKQNHDDNLVN